MHARVSPRPNERPRMEACALSLFYAALANLSMVRTTAHAQATSLRLFPPDSCFSRDGGMTALRKASAADRLASRRLRATWRDSRVETRPERWEETGAAQALRLFLLAYVVPRRWSWRTLPAAFCLRPSRACADFARSLAHKANAVRTRYLPASCRFDVPVVQPSCCERAGVAARWRADVCVARAEAAEGQVALLQAVSSVSQASFAS